MDSMTVFFVLAVYIASSVTLSIAALFAGMYLMRRILTHPL